MRLSDDKINELSHRIAKALEKDERVELLTVLNSVRLAVRKSIGRSIRKESQIDQKVREKISRQKRNIMEGSSEWEAIYWQYYEDEISALHVIK